MDKEELRTILVTACNNVDKLERIGVKLNRLHNTMNIKHLLLYFFLNH